MILDLDIGNTRVKWRGNGAAKGVLRTDRWQAIIAAECGRPARIRVANVAGKQVADEIDGWARGAWGIVPEFAVTHARAMGVACGYSNPSSMGVDRWLAVIAAYSSYQQDLLVVNAGSAVTLDLVRADGRHEGGYIVPGLELQRRALFEGTSNVKVDAGDSALMPGADTASAVRNGSLLMTVAFVERCARELGKDTLTVVAGGDTDRLVRNLTIPVVAKPELVLDGLAVLLP